MVVKGVVTQSEQVDRRRGADESAWADLVRGYSRYVYAICIQAFNLSGEDLAEAFNEVFAHAYENFDPQNDEAVRQSWIAHETRELAADRFGADVDGIAPTDLPPNHVVDQRVARIDEALKVRRDLEHVPPGRREIVDRFFACDESFVTIAAALDIPVGTIAGQISRCLAKLEIEVEADERRGQGGRYDEIELGQLLGVLRPEPPYWAEAARRHVGVRVY